MAADRSPSSVKVRQSPFTRIRIPRGFSATTAAATATGFAALRAVAFGFAGLTDARAVFDLAVGTDFFLLCAALDLAGVFRVGLFGMAFLPTRHGSADFIRCRTTMPCVSPGARMRRVASPLKTSLSINARVPRVNLLFGSAASQKLSLDRREQGASRCGSAPKIFS